MNSLNITLAVLLTFLLSGCFLKTGIADLGLKSSGDSLLETTPTLVVTLESNEVQKNTVDQELNTFITVDLNKSFSKAVTVNVTEESIDATISDYLLEATTLVFQAGETSKKIKLTVKGRSGSKDWNKSVKLTFKSAEISGEVTKTFIISDSNALVMNVQPFYPTLGASWNSYISSGGTGILRLISPHVRVKAENFPPETACNLAGLLPCVHAGEMKKVIVSSYKSCAGLTMSDSENAFEWRCSESATPVFFYSLGFNKGKGLKNLILATGLDWKTMSVSVFENGSLKSTSTLTKWWNNSIVKYDTGNINSGGADPRLNLNAANTIYSFVGSLTSRGITIGADGVSLVTLPGSGVTSTATIATEDCSLVSGGTQNCFIFNNSSSRVWIEGKYTGIATLPVFMADLISTSPHSVRIHGSYFSLGTYSVFVYRGRFSMYTDSTFATSQNGISNGFYSDSTYLDLNFENITNSAIDPGNTSMNAILLNIRVSNTGDGIKGIGNAPVYSQIQTSGSNYGYRSNFVNYAIVLNSVFNNNAIHGIDASNGHNLILNNTAFGNLGAGVNYSSSSSTTLSQILSVNNATGLRLDAQAMPIEVNDIATIDNANAELQFTNNSRDITFKNKLKVGRTTSPCLFGTGHTGINLANANCDATAPAQLQVQTGMNANDLFSGFATDTKNTHGSEGAVGKAFAAITDWQNFDSFYRAWIPFSSSLIPTASLRGRCTAANCGIFDLKVKLGAHGFKNYNGTFVANAPCPSITKGSNAIVPNPFLTTALQGASEFILDGLGNDNGLCEASEACYFLPDMGANIFELPTLNDTCIYDADGSALTGITIYGKSN